MTAPKPRVLHCISHFALGGAERVAMQIIQLLDTQINFSVFAVRGLNDGATGAQLADELKSRGVPFRCGPRIPMRFGGMISGAIGLARAIDQFAPDVVHLHTEIPEASAAVMLATFPRLRRIPMIRTIHNSVFWAFSPKLGHWCDRRLSQAHCIAVSESAARAILGLRRDSGAPPLPAPPEVIFNTVSPAPSVGPRPRHPSEPIRLLFGGRFESEKGVDLLPEILSRVRLPAGRTAKLTIFGTGKFQGPLELLRDSPPPGWEVEVYPPIPEFRAQLPHHDLFLMPSRFEGLPLVALEAALAHLPIISTRAPGLREALPAEHPWLAEPGDAKNFASVLTTAMAQPEKWAHVAESTLAFVNAKFDASTMATAHRAVYQKVISKETSA